MFYFSQSLSIDKSKNKPKISMSILPKNFQKAKEILSKFPAMGARSAERFLIYLLNKNKKELQELSDSLSRLDQIKKCSNCFFLTENQDRICDICKDKNRKKDIICILEDSLDLMAIENKNIFQGQYHVLGGTVRIGQKDNSQNLTVQALKKRIMDNNVQEIIIATNPNSLGDATAVYLKEELQKLKNLKITRISKGMPTGGDLEYADKESLEASIEGRIRF
ncbi:MAG: recombination protein RecR [Candidatus Moranbacteria bacterium]|nr:recombination protein RecR [Candidatus Moranbacteria bacterium]